MSFLEWQERFETGLPGYDAQHQTLFRLANRIHDCLENETPASDLEVSAVLEAFLEMTQAHVRTEDELMIWEEFAPAADHVSAHQRFTQYLEATQDPGLEGGLLRQRLHEALLQFKAHFEDEDEQSFLALLRRKHLLSPG